MTRSSVRTDSRQVANPRRIRLGQTPIQATGQKPSEKPVHGEETTQESPWDVPASEVVQDEEDRAVVHPG
ncbi:MAG TPA: hypothetical protein VFG87_08395 [Amycolatopsis sp.]|nr:hypothetical protein [Amycolatopsis sp.]